MTIRVHQTGRLLVGIFFVFFAQVILLQNETTFFDYGVAESLQDLFHFDLINTNNMLSGFILLFIGAVLIWRSVSIPPAPDILLTNHEAPNLAWLTFLRKHLSSIIVGLIIFAIILIRLAQIDRAPAYIFLWLIVIILFTRIAFFADRERNISLSLNIDRWDGLWLSALIAAGLIIGAWQLTDIPNNLISDEGIFYERASFMSKETESLSFFDVGPYSYPLPGSFYQALFIRLFGESMFSWRFSSVVAGVLTVFPVYLLAHYLFNRRTAIIAGILLITMPYLLAFERMGYNNAHAIFPVALTFYLMYVGLRKNSILYMAAGGIAAGIGFYTYTAGRLGYVAGAGFLGVLFLSALINWLRQRKSAPEIRGITSRNIRWIFILSFVFGFMGMIMWLPHIVHTSVVSPDLLRYKTLESLFPNVNYAAAYFPEEELFRDYPPIDVGEETFFFRADLYARLIIRGVVRTLLAMHDATPTNSHYIVSGLAGPVAVIFYFLGLIISLKGARQRRFFMLIFWFISGLLILSMLNTFPARHQHLVPIIPVIVIFTAIGVVTCVDSAAEWLNQRRSIQKWGRLREGGITALVAGGLLALLTISNLRNYFVEMPPRYLPDLENIIAWDALHLTQQTEFVYIFDDTGREDFIPWVINYIPTLATFQTISDDRIVDETLRLMPDSTYKFYFPMEDPTVLEGFIEEIGLRNAELQVYEDAAGRILGRSIMFQTSDSGEPITSPEAIMN